MSENRASLPAIGRFRSQIGRAQPPAADSADPESPDEAHLALKALLSEPFARQPAAGSAMTR
jgi:hypothetical protein